MRSREPRVFHCIWWIPHYRAPIFRRLSQSANFKFEVLAGTNSKMCDGTHIASAAEVGILNGVRWRKVASRRLNMPLLRGWEWQPESIRAVLRENVDAVIVLGNQSLSNQLIRIACRLRRIPLIDWTQGVRGPEEWLKWTLRKQMFLRWPNAHLLYGEFARDWYAAHGFDRRKLFVVRNSLDYDSQVTVRNAIRAEDIERVRREFGVCATAERLIVHSTRVERSKRLDLLLEGLKQLLDRGRRVSVVLIGGGAYLEELRSTASSLGIGDRVHLIGPCYDERRIGEIFSASDLCVVPGEVGLVAMHSLVYGTPILACENSRYRHGPEIEAVKSGETGGYFKDGDSRSLASCMEEMLYPEPAKARMSSACRRMIDDNYTPQYQEKVIVQALNSVLPNGVRADVSGVEGG